MQPSIPITDSDAGSSPASALAGVVPVLSFPQIFSVEAATLGRQPNNDGDRSGAMYFE